MSEENKLNKRNKEWGSRIKNETDQDIYRYISLVYICGKVQMSFSPIFSTDFLKDITISLSNSLVFWFSFQYRAIEGLLESN